MGMKYIRGLSADMEDLPTKQGQHEAKKFWAHFLWSVKQDIYEPCYLKTTKPKHKTVTVPKNPVADSTTTTNSDSTASSVVNYK